MNLNWFIFGQGRWQAVSSDPAFSFKQWGAWGADGVKQSKYDNGKLLKGRGKADVAGLECVNRVIENIRKFCND